MICLKISISLPRCTQDIYAILITLWPFSNQLPHIPPLTSISLSILICNTHPGTRSVEKSITERIFIFIYLYLEVLNWSLFSFINLCHCYFEKRITVDTTSSMLCVIITCLIDIDDPSFKWHHFLDITSSSSVCLLVTIWLPHASAEPSNSSQRFSSVLSIHRGYKDLSSFVIRLKHLSKHQYCTTLRTAKNPVNLGPIR